MKNKIMKKYLFIFILLFLLTLSYCGKPKKELIKKDLVMEALISSEKEEGLSYQQSIGKKLFIHYCGACHGDYGEGNGINSYNLNPPPPNLKESLKKRKAEEIRKIIEYGSISFHLSPLSPPYKYTLKKEEIDAILSYLLVISSSSD